MKKDIPKQVQELYANFDEKIIATLPTIYRADIIFRDPLQRIEGLDNLRRYYQ